jgi:hypothetical protein
MFLAESIRDSNRMIEEKVSPALGELIGEGRRARGARYGKNTDCEKTVHSAWHQMSARH